MNTRQLRITLRQQRRALSLSRQRKHQLSALKQLKKSGLLKRHKRFAIYLHGDGELHTDIIFKTLLKMKKQVFLPVLYPYAKNQLWFYPYKADTQLVTNRFNIAEPPIMGKPISPCFLDVVLMPLVGFDDKGNRIGMGGGFYDRTFAFTRRYSEKRLPMLIGLAHDLQQCSNIKHQPWDIRLDGVITEKKVMVFTKAFNS